MSEKHIGNYRILKQIGVGGMAKVYLAVHKDVPNLKVVLKILTSPQHAERFMQEADKLALLDGNPNICQIRHFFDHEDELVIAMEHIEGTSLDKMLEQKGKMSPRESLRIVIDLLSGLAPAHEKEIYHRDIKPSNVMFEKTGRLKIIDFGIAKGKTDPQMTIVGTAAGTPAFMAPEQFAAGEDVDYSKCDIYAVGTILYRMLTGEMPFKGDNEFVLRDAKMFEEPPLPSTLAGKLPAGLDDIVMRAIDKDASGRFASIQEMKSELQMIYDVLPVQTEETSVDFPAEASSPNAPSPTTKKVSAGSGGRSRRTAKKKTGGKGRIFAIMAGVAIVIVAGIFIMRMISGDEEPETILVADSSQVELEQEQPAGPVTEEATGEDRTEGGNETVASESESRQPVREETPPPPPPGTLLVTSRPGHAQIYINGRLRTEPTPFRFQLSPGRYTVKMVRDIDGQQREYSESVIVKSGEVTKVSHNFEG